MKPEQKPFVVEFKNRRRLTRKETSIWGPIDLKTAGDAIAAEQKVGNDGDAPGRDPRLIVS
ncbi:hypothetical protein G6M85_21105 [Agrobacterium tumefaciens]|uniref:hypothetical protein n=1 Tax=Agrobacterium tumefaciens TaxID=358 RepID=UPI0015740699|nr:hypothetical protein [Agrobacterium tumefaciens]NTE68106.1 hypothetical protein [Agrobacterium tumefaciens]